MILSRRKFLTALVAAPIVVRSGILMPVKKLILPPPIQLNERSLAAAVEEIQRLSIKGVDAWGKEIVEVIALKPGAATFKQFKQIHLIEEL